MKTMTDPKSKKGMTICPYLGLVDDPETTISYPSISNYCHRSKPAGIIVFDHQQQYCLDERHTSCPVFQREKPGPLPKEIRVRQPGITETHPWLPVAALLSIIALGIALSMIFGIIKLPSLFGVEEQIANTKLPPTAPIPTSTNIPTRVPPTATATISPTSIPPTVTPTQQAYRLLETPLPEYPNLMIHRLKEGEGINLLAQLYNTTSAAISAVNYNLAPVLWINSVIVIPVGATDVAGLPKFSTYEVQRSGISIEEFSQSNQLDADQLKKYNVLPDGYILTQGEWLIIPHSE